MSRKPELAEFALRRSRAEKAIAALARGEQIIVVDDVNHAEAQGFFVAAAAQTTSPLMAAMVRYSSGFVCVALPGDTCDRLDLPAMEGVTPDTDSDIRACVTVDAIHGTSTGISAHDRARTAALLADPHAARDDFTRPGHVVPVRTAATGLSASRGIAEAASFLTEKAGHGPAASFAAAVGGTIETGLPGPAELMAFATARRLSLVSISDVHLHMLSTDPVVTRELSTRVLGQEIATYVGTMPSARFQVLITGSPDQCDEVPLYVHSPSQDSRNTDSVSGVDIVERSMVTAGRGIVVHVQSARPLTRPESPEFSPVPFAVADILHDVGIRAVCLINGDTELRTVLQLRDIAVRNVLRATPATWESVRALHAS